MTVVNATLSDLPPVCHCNGLSNTDGSKFAYESRGVRGARASNGMAFHAVEDRSKSGASLPSDCPAAKLVHKLFRAMHLQLRPRLSELHQSNPLPFRTERELMTQVQ